MRATNADACCPPATITNLNPPMFANRGLILGNLIPLGQIRVEIVLSRELIIRRNRTVQRQTGTNRHFDCHSVDNRQAAWQTKTDRTGLTVGRQTKCRAAPAEHLGVGPQLCVDLHSDDRLKNHPRSGPSSEVRPRSRLMASRPASNASRSTDCFVSTNSLP